MNNVFLVVQLTSFDRKDFYIDDSKSMGKWQTIWPNWNHDYGNYELNTFADSYSTSVYSDKENLNRYLYQIFNFQNQTRICCSWYRNFENNGCCKCCQIRC